MNKSQSTGRLGRTLVAVATSIFTGATAGAALARKPLVVRCDEQRTMRRAA